MIALLFISLAAFCKAVADTLEHHYSISVFKNLNEKWWNPDVSYKYVGFIKWTKYRPDAWHLANSGMIVFMIMAVVTHQSYLWWFFELVIGGLLWNGVFNLFYNKILR